MCSFDVFVSVDACPRLKGDHAETAAAFQTLENR